MKNVLIAGGAGFIGSHLTDALLDRGYHVRILDILAPQVHGDTTSAPGYLNPEAEFIAGDIRDAALVHDALRGIDAVFQFAAAVGVGQSMYRIAEYCSVNDLGTAILLEQLISRPVERLIVASSMSVYGEGLYHGESGLVCENAERNMDQLRRGKWEPRGPGGEALTPVPTPETKLPSLASVYALSKFNQEKICQIIGRAYHIPTVALRFFNVYGVRQALSNPYTGVMAIFASRILNGNPPLIYEDGGQQRDFVAVEDVARACILALETPAAPGKVFNVGSGEPHTIMDIARAMCSSIGREDLAPAITGKYRMGDIRHCFADISLAKMSLGFEPRIRLLEGMKRLAAWLETQAAVDRADEAGAELAARGLAV